MAPFITLNHIDSVPVQPGHPCGAPISENCGEDRGESLYPYLLRGFQIKIPHRHVEPSPATAQIPDNFGHTILGPLLIWVRHLGLGPIIRPAYGPCDRF